MGYSFNFNFSEEDFEYDSKVVKYFSYGDFYINEFFNLNDFEKVKIYNVYRRMYGDSSYNYFIRNYAHKWNYGDRRISDTQWVRMYTVMESNLTEKSKLKLGRIEFFRLIKTIVNSYFKDQSLIFKGKKINDITILNKFFEDEIGRINKHDPLKKEIKNVIDNIVILTEEEKIEAFEISELLCAIKLETQINQIVADLSTFSPYLKNNKVPNLNCSYTITLYNINLDLKNIDIDKILKPQFNEVVLKYKSKYKDFVDKYLANELVELNKSSNEMSIKNIINQIDLDDFFKNIESLKNTKNQHELKYTFYGEGGELKLDVIIRHYTIIITEMAKSILYIILSTLAFGSIVIWVINKEVKILFIFLGIYIIYPYLSIVSPNLKKLLQGFKDLKQYGK